METTTPMPETPSVEAPKPEEKESNLRHADTAFKAHIQYPFSQMWSDLKLDLKRLRLLELNMPEDQTFVGQYIKPFMKPGTQSVVVYRFGRWIYHMHIPVVRQILMLIHVILDMYIMVVGGIRLHPYGDIGPGLVVRNFSCIFILAEKIGRNCTVNQGVNVTHVRSDGRPIIGDNVYLGTQCVVMGKVKIGNNVVVAANSLVIADVPDNCTVMGVPARVMSRNNDSPYLKVTV